MAISLSTLQMNEFTATVLCISFQRRKKPKNLLAVYFFSLFSFNVNTFQVLFDSWKSRFFLISSQEERCLRSRMSGLSRLSLANVGYRESSHSQSLIAISFKKYLFPSSIFELFCLFLSFSLAHYLPKPFLQVNEFRAFHSREKKNRKLLSFLVFF